MAYEMFSEEGDALVADLIQLAQQHGLDCAVVTRVMSALARDSRFGEITDTAVREQIGSALGWYE